jgi:quercetin dioxygenase-like cupin family protein
MPIHSRLRTAFAIAGAAALVATSVLVARQQPAVKRTVLLQHDLMAVPNYQSTLVMVEIPAGGREGRHIHAGTILVHVEAGELTLDYEGEPTVTYKAGESFFVDPGKVHEGINRGNALVKAVASFVTEKGKPLTTQVPN